MLSPDGGRTAPVGDKTFAWYQQNDVRALEAMPVADPEKFKELYKAEFGKYPV